MEQVREGKCGWIRGWVLSISKEKQREGVTSCGGMGWEGWNAPET